MKMTKNALRLFRVAAPLALAALVALPAPAEQPEAEGSGSQNAPYFRDLFEVDYISWSDDRYYLKCENVFLWDTTQDLIPEIRIQAIKTDYGRLFLAQPGLVYVIGRGFYVEVAGGGGMDQDDEIVAEGFAEITFEGERITATARAKGGWIDASEVGYFIPDASFQYAFSDRNASKVKYFLGLNSEEFVSHTLQVEHRFTIRKGYTIGAILTGIREDTAGEVAWAWAAGARAQARITEHFGIRWLAQYHRRDDGVWGIENSLTLDVRF